MTNNPNKHPPAYDLSGWSLADLLPDADEKTIAAHLAQLGQGVEAFEALRPRLHEDATPADVLTAVEQFESITEQILCARRLRQPLVLVGHPVRGRVELPESHHPGPDWL